jgi:DNA-binding LytR/AlgR family response regulator
MKVVIIEDEKLTTRELVRTIFQIDPSIEITATLMSVREAMDWFAVNPMPDLIFSDIQLGDGLSFEVLGGQFVPVIFCTAYDEYALKAFNANGIDYILKPFTTESVAAALQKFQNLTRHNTEDLSAQYETIRRLLSEGKHSKPSSLLIHYRDTIRPIKIEDIALFEYANGVVHIMTFDKIKYYPGKSLDELEELVGDDFFRVNRRFLVNRKTIVDASSTFSRKMSLSVTVPVTESITISKEKAPNFLKWLTGS